ncbi:unnamed protein product [Blepharisma stoltei]|uniref:Uncharacterized protein n=1 Tax=Blepharisma stoltei TaxID=1481888 RepID=A0AAU9K2T4_9CILI|nr:unnamed protein product [Blepharisma stoltei]
MNKHKRVPSAIPHIKKEFLEDEPGRFLISQGVGKEQSSSSMNSSSSYEAVQHNFVVPFDEFKQKTLEFLKNQNSKPPLKPTPGNPSLNSSSSENSSFHNPKQPATLYPLGEKSCEDSSDSQKHFRTKSCLNPRGELSAAMKDIQEYQTAHQKKLEFIRKDVKQQLLQMVMQQNPSDIDTDRMPDLRESVESTETLSGPGSSVNQIDEMSWVKLDNSIEHSGIDKRVSSILKKIDSC